MNGIYQVSSLGRIKSLERLSDCCYHKKRKIKEKIIVPNKLKNNYLVIMLSNNKKTKRYFIHKLVAKAFLKEYDETKVIHHIDYNSQNNNYKNLYVCTRSEHTTLHNKTDRLIREIFKNNLVKFENGEYVLTNNCYKVVE